MMNMSPLRREEDDFELSSFQVALDVGSQGNGDSLWAFDFLLWIKKMGSFPEPNQLNKRHWFWILSFILFIFEYTIIGLIGTRT